ncbi:hypothetical protein Q8A67_024030 [Cirrhinus molitorella]|uniref:Uncharacterized protein n=1 Tax=Cirrhinus molitorella TaxID=172907 RepID=A0AA88P8N6_9TELE|nr:hypothetical protein Q8A67_024030 [Cirrhinus molitorella]
MANSSARSRKGTAAMHNCSGNGARRFEWGDIEGNMDLENNEDNERFLGNRWIEVGGNRGEKRKDVSDEEEPDKRSKVVVKCIVSFSFAAAYEDFK